MKLNDFLPTLITTTDKTDALVGIFRSFTPDELNGILGTVQSGDNAGAPRSAYAIRNGGSEPISVDAGDSVHEFRLAIQRAKSRVGTVDVAELKRSHTVAMAEKLVTSGTFENVKDALNALNTTL